MNTIFWASDSTVKDNYYDTYPQSGIGQAMRIFVKKGITIKNFAENGRSTKSFISEGLFRNIEDQISKDDILLIQFGHNDEKPDEERHTEPYGEYKRNLIYMANVAIEHQAHPIFITSLYRRLFNEFNTLIESTHGEYPAAMIATAKELNIPCIDLCSISYELLKNTHPNITAHWYMNIEPGRYKNYPNGNIDNTHLQYEGAVTYAEIIYKELKTLGGIYSDMLRD